MRILFVTDIFPYPSNRNGNTENIYNLLTRLKDTRKDLLYLGNLNTLKEEYVTEIEKITDNLILAHLPSRKLLRFVALLKKKNFEIENKYDIVFFCTFLAGYSRLNFNLLSKYILYQADSRTLYYSKLSGIKNKIRYYKFRIEQKTLFRYFHKIIFVSEFDKKEADTYLENTSKTIVIPIGCNPAKLTTDHKDNKDIDLIFTGNFHFLPNSDAAISFMKNVVPKLVAENKELRIYFAGRYPTSEMMDLAGTYPNNIVITGEVNDLTPYLQRSKIYISPLYLGSGMKNKILQAMSCSLPIVASIESTAGISNKESILIANTVDEWLTHIRMLLMNKEKRDELGSRNYDLFRNFYDFDKLAEQYFIPFFRSISAGQS